MRHWPVVNAWGQRIGAPVVVLPDDGALGRKVLWEAPVGFLSRSQQADLIGHDVPWFPFFGMSLAEAGKEISKSNHC